MLKHIFEHHGAYASVLYRIGRALGSLFGMAGFVGLSTKVVSKMISVGLSKTAGQLLRKGLAKHAIRGGLIGTAIGYAFYEMFFKFGEGGYIPATLVDCSQS